MKRLTVEKGLEVNTADDADIYESRRFFGDAAATWLLSAVNKKTHRANCIDVAGATRYVLIWPKDAQNRLFVNCVIERNGGGYFPEFIAGLKQLARENGCIGMAGSCTRDGLLKKLLAANWQAYGVAVRYDFD
jgi:hypothetical protein